MIDADACPVVRITEQVAREKGIPVTLLCDTNHELQSDYSEVITVGTGADAVGASYGKESKKCEEEISSERISKRTMEYDRHFENLLRKLMDFIKSE